MEEDIQRMREMRKLCNEPYALQDIPKLIYKLDVEFLLALVERLEKCMASLEAKLAAVSELCEQIPQNAPGFIKERIRAIMDGDKP